MATSCDGRGQLQLVRVAKETDNDFLFFVYIQIQITGNNIAPPKKDKF